MAAEIEHNLASPKPPKCETCRVLIATRNDIARAGINAVVQTGDYGIVACCAHEHDLFRSAKAHRPNIILVADNIAPQRAASTVLRLRSGNRSVMIIFLLDEGRAISAAKLLDLDVDGILLNAACASSVIDCLENVRHGRKWIDPDLLRHLAMAKRPSQTVSGLTPREIEIAHLVSRAMRNKEIARQLQLSEGTVKMHLHHIYERLRLTSRAQLSLVLTAKYYKVGSLLAPVFNDALWEALVPALRTL
jgi:DNA-binding NarL/FixJ family response regulator